MPKPAPSGPRTAFLDTETSPSIVAVYNHFMRGGGSNVLWTVQPWHFFSFSYQWLGEKKIHTHSLTDYPSFDNDIHDDRALCQDLWRVLDEATHVIAHNGDRFDIKKTNTRFLIHRLPIYSPVISIDTLKIAKRYFAFDSNRLDYLGRDLGVGRKVETKSRLNQRCFNGDRSAFKEMCRYNEHDVRLLADVYGPMAPYHKTHPDLSGFNGNCPVCQSSNVQQRGFNVSRAGKKPRFQCQDCSHWWSAGKNIKEAA